MKVLYIWAYEDKHGHEAILNEVQSWGHDIKMIDFQHWLGAYDLSWEELDRRYRANDPELMRFYTYIHRISKQYDIMTVNYANPFHPEFLRSLKGRIFTVLHSGNDPQGSSNCSEQYVKYFDYSFCYGGVYDKNTTIVEKFKEWGAQRADRWVYGFRKDMYNPDLTVRDIFNKKRDIDVIVATTPWKKEDGLSYLKTKIPKAEIHGRNYFGIMGGHILRTLKKGKLPNIGMIRLVFASEIPDSELVGIYQRSKIGINLHLGNIDDIHEFGCSGGNLRTTQLPANGVMQISGCKNGVKNLFEVGEEIVCFDDLDKAVRLVRYYLEHDDERKEIAANGFIRAIRDYKCEYTFNAALSKITSAMSDKPAVSEQAEPTMTAR